MAKPQSKLSNPAFEGKFKTPIKDAGPFACLTEQPLDKRMMQEIVLLLQTAACHMQDQDIGGGWLDRLQTVLDRGNAEIRDSESP